MFFTARFILDLAAYAEQKGFQKEAILEASGKTEEYLTNPVNIVDYTTVEKAFTHIEGHYKGSCFGLHLGQHIDLLATAYVDEVMNQSSTVEDAFENAVRYSRLISDSMQCELVQEKDCFRVYFDLHPEWKLCSLYAIQQNLDLALLCALRSLHRLTKADYFPLEVNFFYPKPKWLHEYYRLFNCRINFNQPISSIVFSRHLLRKKVQPLKGDLLQSLKSTADAMLRELPKEKSTTYAVKKLLLQNASPASFKINHVAEKLHLSVRSLQRHLKHEKISFLKIQNELRFKLALKFFKEGNTHLDEVAYLVGYSESSALIRAFKNQTGTTPKKYIEQYL